MFTVQQRFLCATLLSATLITGCQNEPASNPGGTKATPPKASATERAPVESVTQAAPAPSSRSADHYAGQQSCVQCHAEIVESYQTHPMSRSACLASELSMVAPGESATFDPPGPRRYRVSRSVDGLWSQTEEFPDVDGQLIYEDTVPTEFAVGSGQRGYSFVTNRNGYMTMGVATWYTGRNCWDLSPGFAPESHARFSRRMADGCVVCHFGRTNLIPNAPNRFASEPFAELTIGCERCHGPAEQHVKYHENGATKGEKDPILSHSSLGFAEQLSVCYQCHLPGEERVVRTGHSEYDFRPGMKLSDVWVTFVRGGSIADESTAAVSQVEQMHLSTCFQKSGQKMTCTSCHNPHRSPSADERTQLYREACLKCHAAPEKECAQPEPERRKVASDDSCIACHMPSLPARDVPHTSQTDHRVMRIPMGETAPSEAKLALFHTDLFPIPPAEERRARGLLLARKAESTSSAVTASTAINLLGGVVNEKSTDVPAVAAYGSASQLVGDTDMALKYLNRALQLSPQNETVLRTLVVTYEQRSEIRNAMKYLDRAALLSPSDGLILAQRGKLLMLENRKREAFSVAKELVRLLPHDRRYREWLADMAKEFGETELENEQRGIIERMKAATAATTPPKAATSKNPALDEHDHEHGTKP